MHPWGNIGFLGCPHTRADDNAIGAEHQGSGEPTSVANTAGRAQKGIW